MIFYLKLFHYSKTKAWLFTFMLRALENRIIKLPISDVYYSFAYLKHINQSWQPFLLRLKEASHPFQHTNLGNCYQPIQASTGNEINFSIPRLELQNLSNS